MINEPFLIYNHLIDFCNALNAYPKDTYSGLQGFQNFEGLFFLIIRYSTNNC